MNIETPEAALERAIAAIGGPAAVGRLFMNEGTGRPVTGQAVSQWKACPAGRVLTIEAASGVPRHVLRPDIYPAPTEQGAAA